MTTDEEQGRKTQTTKKKRSLMFKHSPFPTYTYGIKQLIKKALGEKKKK
jgi:hypothetical protein